MATLIGSAAKPNSGAWEAFSSTFNVAAEVLTMPERGRLVSVGIWANGSNQTATARVAVWQQASPRTLLGQSATFTLGNESPADGHVDLYVVELETPVELDAGVSFYAGFWRDKSRSHQLSGRSSGAHVDDLSSTVALPSPHTGGHGFGDYSVGVHAYYEPIAGAYVRRSGAWVRATDVLVRRSGAWASVERVQVRRSGAWTDAD